MSRSTTILLLALTLVSGALGYRLGATSAAPESQVTGIGGIFFKAKDPEGLGKWYRDQLGLVLEPDGSAHFRWRELDSPQREGRTVWSPFPQTTQYFRPGSADFMINYRIRDLDAVLARLRKSGAWVDPRVETYPYGRFGWARDPEGNRFELWEPSTK